MIRLENIYFLLKLICMLLFASQVQAQLNAQFTVDKYNICSGTNLQMTNTSTNANTFQWFIEGQFYSNARDTAAVLIEGCYDLKEIKLIAGDSISGLSDSASIVVEVFDTCFFHLFGLFLNCPGDTITHVINPEEISTHFYISEPVNILNGCSTCNSIEFILLNYNTYVDRTSTYFGGCYEITTYEYSCFTSGIEEQNELAVRIFPNPTEQFINIHNTLRNLTRYTIYDIHGNNIAGGILNELASAIDLSNFQSGFYFVQLTNDEGQTFTKRIIKL